MVNTKTLKRNSSKKNKNTLRNIIWTFIGCLVLIALSSAVTVINDNGISTGGNINYGNSYDIVNASKINYACYVQKDNATDIQAKINACSYVVIPGGTYKVLSPINIPKSGLTIKGYSMYTNIDCQAITTGQACIQSLGDNRYYNLEITNLNIYGNHSAQDGTVGLDFTNISVARFDSLTIAGFGYGIYASSNRRGGDATYSYYNDFFHVNAAGNSINFYLANHTNENKFYGGYSTGSDSNITGVIGDGSDNNQFIGYSFEGDQEDFQVRDGAWQNGFTGCRFECSTLMGCTMTFDSNGNSWIGGLLTWGSVVDNGINNIVLHNGGYETSSTGTAISVTKGSGLFQDLDVNDTFRTNIIRPWVRSGSTGDLILESTSPTSFTTGRLIFKTMNGANVVTQRLLINNYANISDIDITNSRLDLNNNNITDVDTLNSTNLNCDNGNFNYNYGSISNYTLGYNENLRVNNTIMANIIRSWVRSGSTGDLILQGNSPSSYTTGRILLQSLNSSNVLTDRILINNFVDVSDIDVTNSRLDLNNNNITSIGTINGSVNVQNGNVSVTQGNRLCLDPPTCSHGIYYNGSATIIE